MTPVSVVETLLSSPPTDLLRLLAVPVFGWAAYRDIATRRVPNETWIPLVALGLILLVADGAQVLTNGGLRRTLFLVHVGVSFLIVAPLGYVFWRLGGFGGADAKAVMTFALLFPEFPSYLLPGGVMPFVAPPLGVFSLTILTNTVVVGLAYPLVLAARNAVSGTYSVAMFVGRPVSAPAVAEEYGNLLETPDGLTRRGLDLDALRMYLRWRGLTLTELRSDPARYRDPSSLPPEAERGEPGDGALADGTPVADGGGSLVSPEREAATTDPWGAAEFLASLDDGAYGTTPEGLRDGLDVVAREDEVWFTPGLPFIVPMFVGLVVALTYGDLLYALLGLLGAMP